MLTTDQKKRAKAGKGTEVHYKARQEHPLLKEENTGATDPVEPDNLDETKDETSDLLFHSEHHNDTVDPRDKVLANSG
eukprot:CAMPEP_0198147932 /NCGR_PEP_ID=MMETSP1443-20131203/38608_1 /TAXON_ID=186043 /ORGANISM="Entomoneis sp., Strain CCMP2396" /LENGTH=77 /DNA_ID=CAMNT_0043812459 /DNA_START=206 /DNA_END=439 /DNA_ORIENTATION=+